MLTSFSNPGKVFFRSSRIFCCSPAVFSLINMCCTICILDHADDRATLFGLYRKESVLSVHLHLTRRVLWSYKQQFIQLFPVIVHIAVVFILETVLQSFHDVSSNTYSGSSLPL